MTRISIRIWAVILAAVFVLPVGAIASDTAPNKANEKESASNAPAATSPAPAAGLSASADPLLRLLVAKGVLNATEVNALAGVPAGQVRDRLLFLLKDKGVLSAADVADLNSAMPAATTTAAPAATEATTTIADARQSGSERASPTTEDPGSIRSNSCHRSDPRSAIGSVKA